MILANFQKTIAIDLSAMSSDLSRQDVVNILLDFFSHVTVKSIQFVPVKLAHLKIAPQKITIFVMMN